MSYIIERAYESKDAAFEALNLHVAALEGWASRARQHISTLTLERDAMRDDLAEARGIADREKARGDNWKARADNAEAELATLKEKPDDVVARKLQWFEVSSVRQVPQGAVLLYSRGRHEVAGAYIVHDPVEWLSKKVLLLALPKEIPMRDQPEPSEKSDS